MKKGVEIWRKRSDMIASTFFIELYRMQYAKGNNARGATV
jgi:hypothetical protein